MKLLVVEDSASLANHLVAAFRSAKYDVERAASLYDAQNLLARFCPTLSF